MLRSRITAGPALGLALLLAGCAGSTAEPPSGESGEANAQPIEASVTYAAVGEVVPDFELTWLNHDGGDTLADLRGRVVLLEFWRTF